MNKYLPALAAIAALTATSANASSYHIRNAYVHAGEAEIHNISAFENASEDLFENDLEFAYGFNNRVQVVLGVASAKHEHESFEWFEGAELGFKFALTGEGEYIPSTAVFINYGYNDEEKSADEIALTAIFGKKIAGFSNTLNIELGREVGGGAESGVHAAIKARSTYKISEGFNLGAEYFGGIGEIGGGYGWNEQGHQLGPVAVFEPIEHVHASLALLGGISHDAPESTIKFELGYHF